MYKLILSLSVVVFPAHSFCFEEAGQYYNVNPKLLKAIAKVESNFNSQAVNVNRDRDGHVLSRDYGLMQINSSWFPRLAQFGVNDNNIFDPCFNVSLGAWVLSSNFASHGFNWQSIGAYNAGFSAKNATARQIYITKVQTALAQID